MNTYIVTRTVGHMDYVLCRYAGECFFVPSVNEDAFDFRVEYHSHDEALEDAEKHGGEVEQI